MGTTSLGKCHRLILNSNNDIGTSIVCLFKGRRPPAIAWFIVAAVVNPINRASRRTASHIRKKRFKTSVPFLAHGNSSTTIIMVFLRPWIETALPGMMPGLVFSRIRKAVGFISISQLLFTKTSTASAYPIPEAIFAELFNRPAITFTEPIGIPIAIRCAVDNHKATIAITRNVNQLRHVPTITRSHSNAK